MAESASRQRCALDRVSRETRLSATSILTIQYRLELKQLRTVSLILKILGPLKTYVLLFVIPQRSGGICFSTCRCLFSECEPMTTSSLPPQTCQAPAFPNPHITKRITTLLEWHTSSLPSTRIETVKENPRPAAGGFLSSNRSITVTHLERRIYP